MALTTTTKTLVDATAVTPDSAANALSHGGDHKAIHAALKEVYGIRRYRALVSQSGSSAPTATVLENTFVTTPTWARSSTGLYTLTFGSGEAAVASRLVLCPSYGLNTSSLVAYYLTVYSNTADILYFTTVVSAAADSCMLNHWVSIEVYP